MSDKTVTLFGFVDGQKLRIQHPVLASDSVCFLEMKFQFSEEWDDLVKIAHIQLQNEEDEEENEIIDFIIEDDMISRDKQLNLLEGKYDIWVHGYKADEENITRGTTTKATITVEATGALNGEEPVPIEPTIGEQILAMANYAKETAISANEKADEAKEIAEDAYLVAQEAKEISDDAYSIAGDADNTSQEAVRIAQEALSEADDAFLKAEEAIDAADSVVTIAQESETAANQAKSAASNAEISANKAASDASAALNRAQGALSDAQNAKNIANSADAKADNAIGIANGATSLAVEAKGEAQNAEETSQAAVDAANEAKNIANTAIGNAAEAITMAQTAIDSANDATSNAQTAIDSASEATTKANAAISDANSANTKADTAYSKAESAYTIANGVSTVANNALTKAQEAINAAETVKTDTEAEIEDVKEDLSALNASKLTKPDAVSVGKYFRVASIDAEGNPVLEAVDLPIATTTTLGVVKGSTTFGIGVRADGTAYVDYASDSGIDGLRKDYTYRRPIIPATLDYAVKAAMCDGKGAVWTAEEQNAACKRAGAQRLLSDGWTLKGTLTDGNNVAVDMTGCTEIMLYGWITGTASSTIKTNITSLMCDAVRNGDIFIYYYAVDTPIGLTPMAAKSSNSKSPATLATNGTTYIHIGHNVADTTYIGFGTKANVVECDVKIYAR